MASDDVCYLDLVEVGRRIQARQISSVEVTHAVLDRIARLDARLRSYATLTADLALADAARADAEIARGAVRGPLHGVPIAVKDLCHTKGIATAAGMAIYKDYRPDRDATVVARLHQEGHELRHRWTNHAPCRLRPTKRQLDAQAGDCLYCPSFAEKIKRVQPKKSRPKRAGGATVCVE